MEIWCAFLPISYNVTISLLYPLNSSPFIFSSCVSENHLCLHDKSSYLRAQFDCFLHVHMHYWKTKVQMMSLTLIFFFVFVLSLLHIIKQIDSMLPCICSEINHRRLVVRTLVAHSAYASCAFFFFLMWSVIYSGQESQVQLPGVRKFFFKFSSEATSKAWECKISYYSVESMMD